MREGPRRWAACVQGYKRQARSQGWGEMLTGNRSGRKVEGARRNEWRYESVHSRRLLVILVFIGGDVNQKWWERKMLRQLKGDNFTSPEWPDQLMEWQELWSDRTLKSTRVELVEVYSSDSTVVLVTWTRKRLVTNGNMSGESMSPLLQTDFFPPDE